MNNNRAPPAAEGTGRAPAEDPSGAAVAEKTVFQKCARWFKKGKKAKGQPIQQEEAGAAAEGVSEAWETGGFVADKTPDQRNMASPTALPDPPIVESRKRVTYPPDPPALESKEEVTVLSPPNSPASGKVVTPWAASPGHPRLKPPKGPLSSPGITVAGKGYRAMQSLVSSATDTTKTKVKKNFPEDRKGKYWRKGQRIKLALLAASIVLSTIVINWCMQALQEAVSSVWVWFLVTVVLCVVAGGILGFARTRTTTQTQVVVAVCIVWAAAMISGLPILVHSRQFLKFITLFTSLITLLFA